MSSSGVRQESELAVRRAYEGEERVPLLGLAEFLAVVPGFDPEEPVYVFIQWAPGIVERPYPGTAIWRASLDRYLASDSTKPALRPLVAKSLEHFQTLEAWLRWADFERRARRDQDPNDTETIPPFAAIWFW